MRRLVLPAALALALLPPAGAAAQGNIRPVDETAADAAYGLCPLYLAGQLTLTAPELTERGFGKTVTTKPHPRFGEFQSVEARLADGEIGFGGVPDKVCNIVVTGPKREAALATLRTNMAYIGFDFAPDPANTGERAGAQVETFKAKVDDSNYLYVQLIQAGGPTPMVSAQLFVMDQ